MTRKEAIKIISNYDVYSCGYCHQGGDEVEEAFKMAIKALEQEPNREIEDYENEIDGLYNRLDIAEYDKERLREEVTNLEEKIKALKQEPILDKIRAEIEAEYTRFRNMSDRWCERANGLGTALEIIDKYKKSEDKDADSN